MNRAEYIKTIIKIESEFPVNSIKYKDLMIWPLLRYHIIRALFQGLALTPEEAPYNFIKSQTYQKNYLADIEKYYLCYQQFVSTSLGEERGDLFLVENVIRGNQFMQQKSFHRFYDAFRFRIGKSSKVIGLEFSSSPTSTFLEGVHPTLPIQHLISLSQLENSVQIMTANFESGEKLEVENLAEFYGYLKANNIATQMNMLNVQRKLQFLFLLQARFESLIDKFNAKVIYSVCFYTDVAIAATMAARAKGIKCIELQHGQQGDNEPFFTHWSQVPDSGYEMIPEFFGLWGKESTDRLERSLCSSRYHKIIELGSPFELSDSSVQLFDSPPLPELLKKSNSKIKILVALQHVNFDWFLDSLEHMMEQLGESVSWFFRMHPTHPAMQACKAQFLERIETYGSRCDIEWEASSHCPLAKLLPDIDLCLTQFSTVAYEALQAKTPCLLLLRYPEDHSHMKQEGFFQVTNGEAAVNLIQSKKWQICVNNTDYIKPFNHLKFDEFLQLT